jgi:hypothetical protein
MNLLEKSEELREKARNTFTTPNKMVINAVELAQYRAAFGRIVGEESIDAMFKVRMDYNPKPILMSDHGSKDK